MTFKLLLALLTALLAFGGIAWQFHINGQDPALLPLGTRTWEMAKYFTNITNGLVGIHMLRVVFKRPVSANFSVTVTLSIIMVGIIYRVLLAPEIPKPSPDWYPDFFVHVAVPVLATLWWIGYADKNLRIASMPIWLSVPSLYCVYALIRGAITNIYPYFFFDISRFGLTQVLLNCAGLVVVFGACGALLWGASKLIKQRV